MSEITLQVSDEMLAQLQNEAKRLRVPVESVINTAIAYFLTEDEPTDEEILVGLRQAISDVFAGNTRPADEVLAELKEELGLVTS